MAQDGTTFVSLLDERATTVRGALAIDLAAHFPLWVRRRTTTLTLVDDKTLVQRLAVNMQLPQKSWFDLGRTKLHDPLYVPLNIVEKGTLARFRIVNGDGCTVPMLNSLERNELMTAGFTAIFQGVATSHRLPWDAAEVRRHIEQIVTADRPRKGEHAFASMQRRFGTLLGRADQYRKLLQELAQGFMVLVPVRWPEKDDTGRGDDGDQVFTVTWSQPYGWSGRRLKLSHVPSSLGWAGKEIAFENHAVGWARSTHFEFPEPADVHAVKTAVVTDGVAKPHSHAVYGKPHADVNVPLRLPRRPLACTADRATVHVTLAPRRSGAFAAVMVIAVLTPVLLWILYGRLTSLDIESSTTVAVMLPALLAAALVRQNEHASAGLLLAGVRTCGLAIVLFVFASALFMAVGNIRDDHVTSPRVRCEVATPLAQTLLEATRSSPLGALLSAAGSTVTGLLREAGASRTLDCDVRQQRHTSTVNTSGRVATLVSASGTTLLALVLVGGMGLTHRRISRARGRPDERDGRPVDG